MEIKYRLGIHFANVHIVFIYKRMIEKAQWIRLD